MGILINVDRINAISACMNAILQQVKLSTTKLRQNKDENKTLNSEMITIEAKPSSIYCFLID